MGWIQKRLEGFESRRAELLRREYQKAMEQGPVIGSRWKSFANERVYVVTSLTLIIAHAEKAFYCDAGVILKDADNGGGMPNVVWTVLLETFTKNFHEQSEG